MSNSLADLLVDYYQTQLGRVGSLLDLEREFFILQLGDGVYSRTWADAALAYFAAWNGSNPVGSLHDEAFKYYSSLSGLTPVGNYTLIDHMYAIFDSGGGHNLTPPITDQLEAYYDAEAPDGFQNDGRISKNILTYNQATVEQGTTGLTNTTNCTISRVTTSAAHGSSSLQGSSSAAGVTRFGTESGTAGIPVLPNTQYTAVLEAMAPSITALANITLAWIDSSGSQIISASSGTAALSTSFRQYKITDTSPANAAYASIRVVWTAVGAGEIVRIDKLGLWAGTSTDWVLPGKLICQNLLTYEQATFKYPGSYYGIPFAMTGLWLGTDGTDGVGGCLQGTSTGAGTSQLFANDGGSNRTTDIVPGKDYTVVIHVKAPAVARSVVANISWYNAAGSIISQTTGNAITSSTSWQKVFHTATAPVDTVTARVGININGIAGAGEVILIDKVAFYEGYSLEWVAPYQGKSALNDAFPVPVLADLSGKDRHLLQNNAVSQPLFRKPSSGAVSKNLLTYQQATGEDGTTTGFAVQANCTLGSSTAESLHGSRSITATAVGAGDIVASHSGSGLNATPIRGNTSYTAQIATKCNTAARAVAMQVYFYDSAGASVSNTGGGAGTQILSQWSKHSLTFTSPSNAAYVLITWRIAVAAVAEVHYIDCCGLWETVTPSISNIEWVAPGLPFRNLLTYNQATVEKDTTGWFNNVNTSLSRDTTQIVHGAASLTMTAAGAGAFSCRAGAPGAGNHIPVVAGRTYTAVAYSKAATNARGCIIQIRFYNDAGGGTGTFNGSTTTNSTSAWTLYTVTAVAPDGSTGAVVFFHDLDAATGAGEVHYLDCIGLTEGPNTVWQPPVTQPNNKAAIQFDGLDDLLNLTGLPILTNVTAYIVTTYNSIDSARNNRSFSIYGGAGSVDAYLSTTGQVSAKLGGSFFIGSIPSSYPATRIQSMIYDGASGTYWNNGTNEGGGPKAASGALGTGLSVGSAGVGSWCPCSVMAVLIYSGVHDTDTRQRIERWLGSRFGVAVA